MQNPKFCRIIEIYILLLNHPKKKYSVNKIISHFAKKGITISLRNAQRDLKDLANIENSNISIKSKSNKNFYYSK